MCRGRLSWWRVKTATRNRRTRKAVVATARFVFAECAMRAAAFCSSSTALFSCTRASRDKTVTEVSPDRDTVRARQVCLRRRRRVPASDSHARALSSLATVQPPRARSSRPGPLVRRLPRTPRQRDTGPARPMGDARGASGPRRRDPPTAVVAWQSCDTGGGGGRDARAPASLSLPATTPASPFLYSCIRWYYILI